MPFDLCPPNNLHGECCQILTFFFLPFSILALAEQALVEFIEKATAPVALDSPWIQMHGLPKV